MGSLPELRQISSSPTPQIVPQSNVQHRHNYHPPLAPRHSFGNIIAFSIDCACCVGNQNNIMCGHVSGAEMGLQIRPIVRKDLVDVIHGPLAPALLDVSKIIFE